MSEKGESETVQRIFKKCKKHNIQFSEGSFCFECWNEDRIPLEEKLQILQKMNGNDKRNTVIIAVLPRRVLGFLRVEAEEKHIFVENYIGHALCDYIKENLEKVSNC